MEASIKGLIKAVCISEKKGTEKHPVNEIVLKENFGIEGDAHAGKWHRQVSLLSAEKVDEFNARGGDAAIGAFGENILVSGIDFNRRAGQKTPFYLDALICEPDFAAKLKSGAQDGSKCLACNGCYTIYRKRFVRCVQHQDEIEQFKTIPW